MADAYAFFGAIALMTLVVPFVWLGTWMEGKEVPRIAASFSWVGLAAACGWSVFMVAHWGWIRGDRGGDALGPAIIGAVGGIALAGGIATVGIALALTRPALDNERVRQAASVLWLLAMASTALSAALWSW